MNRTEYRRRFSAGSAPGWDAIEVALRDLYGAEEPRHWGTDLTYAEGGSDPLDGISAYECCDGDLDHLHFVTYGYTDLYYDEESIKGEYSGFGFEMTFRSKSPLPPREEPIWVLNLLQNLARYVLGSGKRFDEYHCLPANGPIRTSNDTDIVGLAFVCDPTLPAIDSPHGRVNFIQAFGLTQSELDHLGAKTATCEQMVSRHRLGNPLLVTDLSRRDG